MAITIAKKQTSGLSQSSSEFSFGAIWRVELQAIVVPEGTPAARGPEHRLAVGGVGLGVVVAEQFALPGVRQRDLRRQGQFEAGLVEVLARLHHFGPEPDRFVTWLWIRQPGREVQRDFYVEAVALLL